MVLDNTSGGDNLHQLAARLATRLRGRPLDGFLQGKTLLRDAVMEELDCSAVRAEALVDELDGQGFVSFDGDPREAMAPRGQWHFRDPEGNAGRLAAGTPRG